MQPDIRERIASAAFELFGSQGYHETSPEDIAAAAGISRSTFFRYYGSKEAVVFPDHDLLLGTIEERLRASTQRSALAAVTDAVKLVLIHYVSEGDRARQRYRLTSTVQALREREITGVARYQRLFRQYITEWDLPSDGSALRAELMASAVVSAHNHVLRRWLRGECDEPLLEVEEAMRLVNEVFVVPDGGPVPSAVVVLEAGQRLADVLPAITRAAHAMG